MLPEQPNGLSLVIPCYNPRENWEEEMAQHFSKFKEATPHLKTKLILVIDGISSNSQKSNLDSIKTKIPEIKIIVNPQNQGKGHALREGVKQTDTDLIMFTDVDFPYKIESMVAVADALLHKADVVLGYRDQTYYEKVPAFRKALSKSFRWSLLNILKLRISDTQCGLKGFNKKGREVFLFTKINRFLFDLEFVKYISVKKGIAIEPVQVKLRDDVVFSTMNMKILLKESINFLFILAKN